MKNSHTWAKCALHLVLAMAMTAIMHHHDHATINELLKEGLFEWFRSMMVETAFTIIVFLRKKN